MSPKWNHFGHRDDQSRPLPPLDKTVWLCGIRFAADPVLLPEPAREFTQKQHRTDDDEPPQDCQCQPGVPPSKSHPGFVQQAGREAAGYGKEQTHLPRTKEERYGCSFLLWPLH